jgi:hypothetical protein
MYSCLFNEFFCLFRFLSSIDVLFSYLCVVLCSVFMVECDNFMFLSYFLVVFGFGHVFVRVSFSNC